MGDHEIPLVPVFFCCDDHHSFRQNIILFLSSRILYYYYVLCSRRLELFTAFKFLNDDIIPGIEGEGDEKLCGFIIILLYTKHERDCFPTDNCCENRGCITMATANLIVLYIRTFVLYYRF